MTRGGVMRSGLLLLAAAGLAGVSAAGAQEVNVELGPLPQPVTVLVRERPTVTAFVRGDYGDVRVTGVLESAPTAPLRLTDVYGRARETNWLQVRSLGQVTYPTEGLPVGSYQVSLVSDPLETAAGSLSSGSLSSGSSSGGVLSGGSLTSGYASRALGVGQGGWRVLQLPEGNLTLRGEPYGTFSVPVSRLSGFEMEPVRGNVEDLPKGNIRLEVFDGKPVSLPLPEVRLFQRDTQAGTATVVLRDEQSFTGKLLEVPKVSLAVDVPQRGRVTLPLEQVIQFERAVSAGRRL